MQLQNEKEIYDVIKKMKKMVDKLKQLGGVLVPAMDELEDVAGMIEQVSAQAERDGDMDSLKTIVYQLIPIFNELDTTYSSLCTILDQTINQKKLEAQIEKQEEMCQSIRKFTHIVVDMNVNTGDYILGRSTRKLVEYGRDKLIDWDIRNVINKVDENYIKECNKSTGIVIGGGGLFLKDTNKNNLSGWTWPCPTELMKKIEVPIYVLGVGYNRFRGQEDFDECFTESVNTLVEKSAFFGLRNHGSIRAVRSYLREDLREKVKFHPCATTVISKMSKLPVRGSEEPYIAINCAFDRGDKRYGNNVEGILLAVAKTAKSLSDKYKIKLYVQCAGDEQFAKAMDVLDVKYEIVTLTKDLTEAEYLHYYTEPELVLAMRGHAQMIPFGCKTPVVSIISHDKLAWFLEDIEHPEWGVDVRDEDFEQKLLEKSLYMLAHREEICAQIEEAQDKLWAIMQENLKSIKL